MTTLGEDFRAHWVTDRLVDPRMGRIYLRVTNIANVDFLKANENTILSMN